MPTLNDCYVLTIMWTDIHKNVDNPVIGVLKEHKEAVACAVSEAEMYAKEISGIVKAADNVVDIWDKSNKFLVARIEVAGEPLL